MTKFLNDTGLGTLISLIKGEINDKKSIYIGTSPSGDAAKKDKTATVDTFPTVTENNVTKPKTGTIVGIKFLATNTYKTANNTYTLNVNSTGAYPMYYNNAELATSTSANTLVAGYKNRYCYYVFNGTQWVWLGAGYDSNTTYSSMTQAEITAGTGTTGRLLTPALLRSNFYTEGEVDAKLPLVVNFTENNNVITCDTSIADIYAAYSAGREVFGRYNAEGQLNLMLCAYGMVTFSNAFGNNIAQVMGFVEDNTDTWTNDSVSLQPQLTFDSTPTLGSSRPVTSEGIKVALNAKQDTLTFDNTPTANSTNPVTSGGIKTAIDSIESDVYIVTCTQTGQDTGTTTATYSEITAARDSGKVVFYNLGGGYYKLSSSSYPRFLAFSCGDDNKILRLIHYVTATDGHSAGDVVRDSVTFQTALTFDNTPTTNSSNPVKSGGIKTALDGKQDKNLLITLTYSNNSWSADKTYAEIEAAHNAGKNLFLTDGEYFYILQYYAGTNSSFYFNVLEGDNYNSKVFYVDSSDSWEYDQHNYQAQLTFDNIPTANSNNPVKSGGIKTALDEKQDKDFVVTVTTTGSGSSMTYSANKTPAECYTAYNAGKKVIFKFNGSDLVLDYAFNSGSNYQLVAHSIYDTNLKERLYTLRYVLYSGTTSLSISDYYLQSELTFDNAPTANSDNPVKSSGIKTAIDRVDNVFTVHIYSDDMVADETLGQIYDAHQAGKAVFLVLNDSPSNYDDYYVMPLSYVSLAGGAFFSSTYNYDMVCIHSHPEDLEEHGRNSTNYQMSYYPLLGGVDNTPTDNSQKVVKSGGVYTALQGKQNTLVSGTNIKTVNSQTLLGSGDILLNAATIGTSPSGNYDGDPIEEVLDEKQDTLVSGTNIKTVNNNSLLGSGNVEVGDITGEELETEIEEMEATLLTDALRKSEQVLLPAEKTQVLTNLGIADVVTQGNLKTVNSASLVGTGNIEIVSTNVGDVTIEQGIGDSQTTVMSQKAVTDEVRKVVAADLAGTSTWIREQLTNTGWVFGKYLTSGGTYTTSTAQPYVITHVIPVDYNVVGHTLIFKYNNDKNTSSYINWYTANGRAGYLNGLNSNTQQSLVIPTNNTNYNNLNGLRFTVNADDIPNCSIYDSTSKKYIWEGAKYLYDFIKDFSINVPWATLLNNVIAQELGTFSQKTVSQKVITDQFDAHDYIDKRYTYMNGALCGFALDDYPNIDVREAEGISLVMDGENVAVSYNAPLLVISNSGSISSTNPMFLIHRYWSSPYVGFMNGWSSPVSGQGTSFPTNKTYNKWAHQVLTFDFNTGEANIYVNGALWTTATVANFDKNAFRTALRAQTHMYLSAPTSVTNPTKITGLAVFPRAITASEVATLFGAGGDETRGSLIPNIYNAYDMLAHPFTTWNLNWHTQTADVTTNENGGKNLTLRSGQTSMQFGFTGLTSKTSFYHSIDFDFTVVNGSCKFSLVQYNNNIFTSPCTITDSNGDVVAFANTTLTSGNTYHMRCVPTLPYNPSSYGALNVGFLFSAMTEGTVLWIHESVVIRERGAALKLLRDNFRGTYWELYNSYQIPIRTSTAYSSNTAFAAYYDPFKQNTVKYNSNNSPQFNGQMAVDSANSRAYVGILNVNGGTWKQINNS